MGKEMRKLLKKHDPKGIKYYESKNTSEENKKAHNSINQSKSYESKNEKRDMSISDSEDIDNGEIYNIKTGKTTRDLI
ncbi:MAG: hypothetical protein KH415_18150 [Clostridium sp.]|nr:hypothetical protein [Clostridium sp.]